MFPGTWPFAALGGAIVSVVLLLWAVRGMGLTWSELGFHGAKQTLRGLVWGIATGACLALGAIGSIWLLASPWGGVGYGVLANAPFVRILERLLVTMPLDTIIVEEVAFRGVLLALLLRAMPSLWAVLVASVVFTAWHVVVNYDTLSHTALADTPLLFAAGLVAAHVGVFLGGALFCLIRLRLGGLPAAIAAHWTVNAVILFAFWIGWPAS